MTQTEASASPKDAALRLALVEINRLCDTGKITGATIETIQAIKAALEAKDEPVALAWAEGYRMGVADERTSEANIGIAGFNAKVEPARENPYATTPPQRKPLTNQQIAEILEHGDVAESNDKVGWYVLPYSFARAIEAAHGIKENT